MINKPKRSARVSGSGNTRKRETRLLHHLQMTFLLTQLPTQVPLSTSCSASLGRPPHGRSDCALLNFLLEYTYAFISGHSLRPKNPRCHRYLHERKLRLSRQLLATPTDETRMNVNHVLQSWRCWMPQKPRMHFLLSYCQLQEDQSLTYARSCDKIIRMLENATWD